MSSEDIKDDEKLRRLFADYQPKLSSTATFTHRLEVRLEAEAYVREQSRRRRVMMRSLLAFTLVFGIVLGYGLAVFMRSAESAALVTNAPSWLPAEGLKLIPTAIAVAIVVAVAVLMMNFLHLPKKSPATR